MAYTVFCNYDIVTSRENKEQFLLPRYNGPTRDSFAGCLQSIQLSLPGEAPSLLNMSHLVVAAQSGVDLNKCLVEVNTVLPPVWVIGDIKSLTSALKH